MNNLDANVYQETPKPYIFLEETDRIQVCSSPQTSIKQEAKISHIVQHQGHDSLVIWNPWSNKAASFVDMQDEEYKEFVCIETALTQGYRIEPGQTHCLKQRIF